MATHARSPEGKMLLKMVLTLVMGLPLLTLSTCTNNVLSELNKLSFAGDWVNSAISGFSPNLCGRLSIKADGTYSVYEMAGDRNPYLEGPYFVEGTWSFDGNTGYKVRFWDNMTPTNYYFCILLSNNADKLEINSDTAMYPSPAYTGTMGAGYMRWTRQ